MNVDLVELAVDLWRFGAPLVLMIWALLRLLRAVPARVRYLIAVGGFLAVLLAPWLAPERSSSGGEAVLGVETGRIACPPLAAAALPPIWFLGALLLVARDVAGHARLRRGWQPAPGALKDLLEWPRAVPLVLGTHSTPITVGLLRPRVVLPADILDTLPVAVVRRIALHELSHAKWRDPLVYALLRILAAMFWIAPVWPLLRWARREREAAADEMALRGSAGEEEHYVEALLLLSRVAYAERVAPAMAASDLEYRARRILTPAPRFSIGAAIALSIGCALLATATPADFAVDSVAVPRLRASAAAPPTAQPRNRETAPPRAVKKRPSRNEAANVAEIVQPLPARVRDLSSIVIPEPAAVHQHVRVDVHVDDDNTERPMKIEDDQRIRVVVRERIRR